MSTQRISTLARERWQKGAHADHHLRVHPDVMEWMASLGPTETHPFNVEQGHGFRGVPVVVTTRLPEGAWHLVADEQPRAVAEWGFIGNPECEHGHPADMTTLADASVRIHWYCGCGAHWFNLSPHARLRYEPVREPAPGTTFFTTQEK